MTREQARKGDGGLCEDSRGAIMVIGVLMGAILVGAMWYIAALGDAAIWRERMLDAADSTAFEASVWNARGMNVIVSLNIVMASVMSLLVIWRLVMAFLATLIAIAVIACVLSFVPFLSPVAGPICSLGVRVADWSLRAIDKMVAYETRTQFPDKILRFCRTMHKAQQIVSAATPIVGTTSSIALSQGRFQGEITAAGAFSSALLPTVIDNTIKDRLKAWMNATSQEGDISAGLFRERLGDPVSLPMQEDAYYKLCEQAGGMVFWTLEELVESVFDCSNPDAVPCMIANNVGGIGDVFAFITGAAPFYFCSSGFAQLPEGAQHAADDAAKARCDCGQQCEDDPANSGFWEDVECPDDDPDCEPRVFKKDKCQEDVKKDVTANSPIDVRSLRVAKVWVYAANGNVFMQAWGIAVGAPPRLDRNDGGISMASRGNVRPEAADHSNFTVAQSEIYYDCDQNWNGCISNAAWRLRWRARLRRLHTPWEMLPDAAGQAVVQSLFNLGDTQLAKLAQRLPIPHLASDAVWRTAWSSKIRNWAINQGQHGWESAAEWIGRDTSDRSDTIH